MHLKRILRVASAALAVALGAGSAVAQDAAQRTVVSYYELIPALRGSDTMRKPVQMLRDYRQTLAQETGAASIELLRDRGLPAHFTLIEVWRDEQAYAAHHASAAAKRFADDVKPYLAGPKDERVYTTFRY